MFTLPLTTVTLAITVTNLPLITLTITTVMKTLAALAATNHPANPDALSAQFPLVSLVAPKFTLGNITLIKSANFYPWV